MRKQRLRKSNKGKAKLTIYVACLILAAIIAVVIIAASNKEKKETEINEGIQYIKMMEGKDTAAIENAIYEVIKEEQIEEIKKNIEVDPETVWTSLEQINTAIIGDSRVTPFINYMNGVYANVGDYIFNIPDFYDELAVQNPNLIVISYGVNDVEWYADPESHATELMGYLSELQSMFPNAYIYTMTIMEALPIAEEWDYGHPDLCAKIRHFNEVESEMLTKNGYRVIDGVPLGKEHIDLYEPDGMHFVPDFYPYWAQLILQRYLSDTMQDG